MPPRRPILRDATDADVTAVNELANALVPSTTYEYTEAPHTDDWRRRWFHEQRRRDFPVVVAERDGEVVGFASYGDFRDAERRSGFRFTVEHTVHVRRSDWGTGVGHALMDELVVRARAAGIHAMIGAIDSENVDSLRFHRRLGFVEVGRLPEVGTKFGRWLDLVLVQRILEPAPGTTGGSSGERRRRPSA